MEDKDIVNLYWQRSENAISETEHKYGPYCRSIAYNICGSELDAEECCNDTWLSAWNSMPEKRPAYLSPFLGGICRNLAINRWRSAKREKRGGGEINLALDELQEAIPSKSNVEAEIELNELRAALDYFVSGLKAEERIIFLARYWRLLPVKEIAERLGLGQSKVKTTLYRLRLRLRDYLQEEGLC